MAARGDTSIGDRMVAVACASSAPIGHTLRRYGDAPVSTLLAELRPGEHAAMQARDDLWRAVAAEATPVLGADAAADLAADLAADPIVPTSNHFGIETVAESVQSTVLYALRPRRPSGHRPVAVFGFGSVSMNNWSYPMGLRLYDPIRTPHEGLVKLPQRLSIFPGRVKQQSVCATEPFTESMVLHSQSRLARMTRDADITPPVAHFTETVLESVFHSARVLRQDSYAAQSPLVNAMLWQAMFSEDSLGTLVQLQVERICARLLADDLFEAGSLIGRLFFDPAVRRTLLVALDGQRACWRLAELAAATDPHGATAGAGTLFFWGLTAGGRRLPLALTHESGTLSLGGHQHGVRYSVPFRPAELADALAGGRIIPSLFTCFAVLALARGLTCVGGYYQAEYLPVMQAAVVDALAVDPAASGAAEAVGLVPTTVCLAGLQGLVRRLDEGQVVPAGPVELAGLGGVSRQALDDFVQMPVRAACLVAFTELFPELFPEAELPSDWMDRLATENATRCAGIA